MPKVSVVIPAFNSAKYIAAAIDSALGQTYKELEVVVVDDGSEDDTGRVVRQVEGAIVYRYQANQGAGTARNLGVSLSAGEWIAFLDADDIWYPDKVAVQMQYVISHPGVDFVYSDIDVMDENGNLTETGHLLSKQSRRKKKPRENLVSVFFDGRPFPYPSTVVVKKTLFQSVGGFNPNFHGNYHEDFELFARMARISDLHFIPRSLAMYRSGNDRGERGYRSWDENGLVLLSCLRELSAGDTHKLAVLQRYFAKHFSDWGKHCLAAGDCRQARECFQKSFSYAPLHWKNLSRWFLSYLPPLWRQRVIQGAKLRRDASARAQDTGR